jgi:hypothetical protein
VVVPLHEERSVVVVAAPLDGVVVVVVVLSELTCGVPQASEVAIAI